jgi:hypothetical protein
MIVKYRLIILDYHRERKSQNAGIDGTLDFVDVC